MNLRLSGLDSIAEHFGALAELRDAGLIRHLGVSNARTGHLAQAQQIAPVVCVQNSYGLGHRPGQDQLLRACGEQGLAFVPFFAIAGAGREAASGAEPEQVLAVAREHQATAAQVRLAWALHRGPHVLVIPGTCHPGHLAAYIAAGGAARLTPGDLARLDAGSPGPAVGRTCCHS